MENYCQQHHRPAVQTHVMKLQSNCGECQRKVKQAMEKVHGVHFISIDANEGKIEATSTIDPRELIAMAAKAGKRPEFSWEPKPESSRCNAAVPVATSPAPHNQHCLGSNFDHFDHTLHDLLAKNRRIKHVELVHRRSVKMTFKDSDDSGLASPVSKVSVKDGNDDNNLRSSPPSSPPSPQRPHSTASCRYGRRESGGGSGAAAAGPSSTSPRNPQNVQLYCCSGGKHEPKTAPVANMNCGHDCCVM